MTAKKRTLEPGDLACAPKNTVNSMKQTGPGPMKGSRTYSPKDKGLSSIKGAVNQPRRGKY